MTTQETPYAVKFAELQPFHAAIFTEIKKDLRDEHLRADRGFFKRNFAGKELSKLTVDDLLRVYPKIIAAGYEPVSEFIANRWLLRHLDVYNFFESRLKECNEKFEQITQLEHSFAESLLNDALGKFGPQDTYIFSVLNSVAFPASLLEKLQNLALQSHAATTTAST